MMTAVQEKRIMTAEEYLKMEREGIREKDGKYEFFNQKLIFMAGASNNHNLIISNIGYTLNHQLRQKDTNYSVYTQDMRTVSHIPGKNYFYPDVEVVEGISFFDDDFKDVLVNPTLIIEVLSDSTEKFDRGDKFKSYRNIPSFREYILVSQEAACLEQFYKNEHGKWEIGDITTEGSLILKSLPFELSIDAVYFKINFNAQSL
jgi:Uma2 family endonuclease